MDRSKGNWQDKNSTITQMHAPSATRELVHSPHTAPSGHAAWRWTSGIETTGWGTSGTGTSWRGTLGIGTTYRGTSGRGISERRTLEGLSPTTNLQSSCCSTLRSAMFPDASASSRVGTAGRGICRVTNPYNSSPLRQWVSGVCGFGPRTGVCGRGAGAGDCGHEVCWRSSWPC